MEHRNILSKTLLILTVGVSTSLIWTPFSLGQTTDADHQKHHPLEATTLEQALDKNHNSTVKKKKAQSKNQTMPGMGGSMGDHMQQMGGMMSMMGKSMGNSDAPSSAEGLPGSPGDQHLYHVGAQDFFLNLKERILLTEDQISQLNQIENQNLESKNKSQAALDQAEENLWFLTSSDRPDMAKIESKIREIEKIKSDERLDFIRSVGKATQVLNDAQRRSAVRSSKYNSKPTSHQDSGDIPKESSDSDQGMKEMPGDM